MSEYGRRQYCVDELSRQRPRVRSATEALIEGATAVTSSESRSLPHQWSVTIMLRSEFKITRRQSSAGNASLSVHALCRECRAFKSISHWRKISDPLPFRSQRARSNIVRATSRMVLPGAIPRCELSVQGIDPLELDLALSS